MDTGTVGNDAAPPGPHVLSIGEGISRHQLERHVGLASVVVRHSTTLVVALICFFDDGLVWPSAGQILLAALGTWSLYRLTTRSLLWQFTAADVCWAFAVAGVTCLLISNAASCMSPSAPTVITSVAVATLGVQLRPLAALPASAAIVIAYACSSAHIVGWHRIGHVFDLANIIASAMVAIVVRIMITRIADTVDQVRAERQAAEVARSVTAARRDFDREQLALLHDTAAATLLMVGQNAAIPAERLAAQAARDLEILRRPQSASSKISVNIVYWLRAETAHLRTPVRFTGANAVYLRGPLAAAVVAAAREVTNNVDRHANATLISIDVQPDRVVIADDGIGFTTGAGLGRHGIRASVMGRMTRAGGTGSVRSAPAAGTVAELSWPVPDHGTTLEGFEPGLMIWKLRAIFKIALMSYAILNLVAAVPPLASYVQYSVAQGVLAGLSALCALTAVPLAVWGQRRAAWVAALVLAVVAVLQPTLLTPSELTMDTNWSQGTIGFCLLPLLLRWPTTRAAAALCMYWAAPAVLSLIRDSSPAMLLFLGLSLAGSLLPQLFASLLSSWAFRAARMVRAENQARLRVLTAERVADAIQTDYLRRYAQIMTTVEPLLVLISHKEPITPEIRRQARAESRRLRTLFDKLQADHPLLFEIRTIVESAEDRGVEVELHFSNVLPDLDPAEVDHITSTVADLIAAARTAARVVVESYSDEISISVVCEVSPEDAGRKLPSCDDATVIWSGQTAWMTMRYRVSTIEKDLSQTPVAAQS
jgi:hypothetical protein